MSSATSIEEIDTGASAKAPGADADDAALRPWQFFVLAGMLSATAVVVVATGQSAASIVVLSLTVVSASLVALGAYRALLPLVAPERLDQATTAAGRARAALEREKTLVLRSIKELEFDFAMGKIAQSDFDELSARLRARAIGLMQRLDAGGAYREAIEREVQARLARRGTAAAAAPEPLSGVAPAAAPPAPDATAPACRACETVNDVDARFCKQCGAPLT